MATPSDNAAKANDPPSGLPYGLERQDLREGSAGIWRTRLALVAIGVPLIAAMLGVLGGGPSSAVTASGPAIEATLVHDPILRSGNWFETSVTMVARKPVGDLTLRIDQPLWAHMSIDTVVPDAESAESKEGQFSYHFGPLKPGEELRVKFDGQIQAGMPRLQKGRMVIADDKRELVAFPVRLTVLP